MRKRSQYLGIASELRVAGIVGSSVRYKSTGSALARDVADAAIAGEGVVIEDLGPGIPVRALHQFPGQASEVNAVRAGEEVVAAVC